MPYTGNVHLTDPLQRGFIFHGLPGNGKTISIKALMHTLSQRNPPVPTLYVKSLGSSYESSAIREIFAKARRNAPCLLVLEDIDSMVTEATRSTFLNEVDGIEGNDGIMLIASTNYCMPPCPPTTLERYSMLTKISSLVDKLDAGISKRPSRFDRKYHFALPAMPQRIQYCEHWM